jgi:hypothetical protein
MMSQVSKATEADTPIRGPGTAANARLLACGIAAGPLYVAVSLAQALTRDGFDLTRHAWSLLANGSLGWIQVSNLVATGVLVIAGTVGLRRVLVPGPGSIWAPRMLAIYGLSLVGAGLFRADPALGFPPGTPEEATTVSWHGVAHFLVGGVGFTCLVVACFVVARRFVADHRPGWAAYSRTIAVLFLAGFLAIAGGGGQAWANLFFVGAILAAWSWLSLTMIHYRRVGHGTSR